MSTMTKRIFRATLLVGVAVLIASLALVMGVLYSYFGRVQESQLRDELSLAAVGVEKNGTDYLRALQSHQYRITWVRADGTVVYDTQVDAETMENHAQRQEIQQALAAGEGESSRYSSTLLQKTVYYAQRLPDGTVLRLSAVRVTAGVLVLNMLQPILLVLAAALILSGVLAGRLARRITEPLGPTGGGAAEPAGSGASAGERYLRGAGAAAAAHGAPAPPDRPADGRAAAAVGGV